MHSTTEGSIPMDESERYRILVQAITDYAIYLLDPNGNVASWNPGAQRIKGYETSEIIGKNFSVFYTPEDLEAELPRKALAAAAREGKFEMEGWRVRKDGSRFWTHVVIDAVRNSSGALIGYAKITRDLTERRQAAEALKKSEEQFKLLVEGVSDYAIYMLDTDGNVSSWNTGAQKIKGYSSKEIIGQHFSTFYTDEDREKNSPHYSLSTARAEGRFESEGWRVRKDGSRFWASVVIDAIKDDAGSIIGFAKITRDISEKKKAEQALFQSQKLEAIGQLTGGIAHDFNNLLMVIQSSMELLRKRAQNDEKMISLVENATKGVKRGVSLTQRMLSFARRQEMDIRPLNIHELVVGMTELLRRSLGPSIQIELRFPITLSKVSADSNQLESAVLNLAVNARDAMPNGGPLIISAHEENLQIGNSLRLAPGKYLCVAIEDRGEGMSEYTLNRAAEPFFTTKGIGKGTGLGLSMVQGFAEQSGGRLRLKSQKNVGTTAEIWLPATDVTDKPQTDEAMSTAVSRLRPLAVLAVDDDVLVLMGTASMLEDLGHTVQEAHSGEEALKILAQGSKIDLVLTDHAMPRMNGVQLAQAVLAKSPNMPIILATGYAELPVGGELKLPRLSKPFTQKQLAQALTEACDRKPIHVWEPNER